MKSVLLLCLSAFLVLISAGCRTNHESADLDQPGIQDQIFVMESIAASAKEIEMGKLGIRRAKDLDLRLLAQRIFDDRTKAQEGLTSLALQKGITMPTNKIAMPHLERLAQISDAQFDGAYVNHLLQTHEQDITKYEAISRSARSQDIQAFAATTLPVLREHQRIAYNIREINRKADNISKEPAGADRGSVVRRDPYYQGDSQRHHQFDSETNP